MNVARQFNLISITLVLLITAGCANSPPAPVIDRQPDAETTEDSTQSSTTTQEVTIKESAVQRDSFYTVQQNDTLYSIGRRLGINYKEIAIANNIPQPYSIHPGQVLIIPSVNAVDAKQTEEVIATTVPLDSIESPTATQPDIIIGQPVIPVISTPKAYREPYSDHAYARESEVIVIEKSLNPPETVTVDGADNVATLPPLVEPEPATVKTEVPKQTDLSRENITWAWPHRGKVLATFGQNGNKGVDIAGKVGQTIKAAANGRVIYSGADLRGYGKMVIVKHNTLYLSVYAHNSHLYVKEGDTVTLGQKIAELGSSETNRPKLHFEIRKQGTSIDPAQFLPAK